MSNMAIYEDGNVKLELSIEGKTIWLNVEDIAFIFVLNRPAIVKQTIIGAYLFVLFLYKNGMLYKPNGETRINDNALASIALLVAQSAPSQKEIIIKLVMNMLYEGEANE